MQVRIAGKKNRQTSAGGNLSSNKQSDGYISLSLLADIFLPASVSGKKSPHTAGKSDADNQLVPALRPCLSGH
nr:MAG TPA: hypothetical protein [Bacteriophage sp.]